MNFGFFEGLVVSTAGGFVIAEIPGGLSARFPATARLVITAVARTAAAPSTNHPLRCFIPVPPFVPFG